MSIAESAGTNSSGMFSSFGAVAANFLQDKMLKKMDTDGNGSVGQGEFQAALEQVGAKLGVDAGTNASTMFSAADADGNGELTGNEVGQMLKNMFSPPSSTDAFVQSRGDEQRFSELDADGDGQISKAEFGINTAAADGMTLVSTTTTTTYAIPGDSAAAASDPLVAAGTTQMGIGDAVTGALPSSVSDATAVAAAGGTTAAGVATADTVTASADAAPTSPLNEDALQALIGNVDKDGDGQISGTELTAFVNQLSSQMEAASKKYNDTAMASFSTSKVNETA